MKNVQQILERYKAKGLGVISCGGAPVYEINSDVPVQLNATSDGFILNEKRESECYRLLTDDEERLRYFVAGDNGKKHYITLHQCIEIEDETDYADEDAAGIEVECAETPKWWGKTLDQYYIHPWYPEKKIIGFTVVKMLPFFDLYEYCEVGDNGCIRGDVPYRIPDCLDYPEYFKPNYR